MLQGALECKWVLKEGQTACSQSQPIPEKVFRGAQKAP